MKPQITPEQFSFITEFSEITPQQAAAYIADASQPEAFRNKIRSVLERWERTESKFPGRCRMVVTRMGTAELWMD